MTPRDRIEIGDALFPSGHTESFGAVRHKSAKEIIVDVEGLGDVELPEDAIVSVHDHKVVVDIERLPAQLRQAIQHAHDREDPTVSSR